MQLGASVYRDQREAELKKLVQRADEIRLELRGLDAVCGVTAEPEVRQRADVTRKARKRRVWTDAERKSRLAPLPGLLASSSGRKGGQVTITYERNYNGDISKLDYPPAELVKAAERSGPLLLQARRQVYYSPDHAPAQLTADPRRAGNPQFIVTFSPEAEIVDRLSTGEAQPRLPGEVGAVRDREVKTEPLADVPFSLTAQAAPERAYQPKAGLFACADTARRTLALLVMFGSAGKAAHECRVQLRAIEPYTDRHLSAVLRVLMALDVNECERPIWAETWMSQLRAIAGETAAAPPA